jgi:outer membrane protein assembly factor BamB
MALLLRRTCAILFALSLAGCGGGGGGGSGDGTPATNTAGAWLTFTPSAPSVTQYQSDAEYVVIRATASRALTTPVRIAIVDPKGLISSEVDIATLSVDSYQATLRTVPTLAVGTHSTTLEVRVCEDAPETCAKPHPGSPWHVPLTVQVKPSSTKTALSDIGSLSTWATYQGAAAHTGFADASFDPAAFSRRWGIPAQTIDKGFFFSTAIDSGRAFFIQRDATGHSQLLAVSEDTGEIAWKATLGGARLANPPAAANGRVYVTTTEEHDNYLWVFEQASGTLVTKRPLRQRSMPHTAPTVSGSDVYLVSGYSGGISKYSDRTGDFSWSSEVDTGDGRSPATDGSLVYSSKTSTGTLYALDAATGATAYVIGDAESGSSIDLAAQVMLTSSDLAVVNGAQLMAFDLRTRTRKWALDTAAYGNVAYANGTVYAIGRDSDKLEARAVATGELLWSTANLGPYFSQLIVTRNLAFASSPWSTIAIDLATHAVVWTYPHGGSLAISRRGVLYILSENGELTAMNLR